MLKQNGGKINEEEKTKLKNAVMILRDKEPPKMPLSSLQVI